MEESKQKEINQELDKFMGTLDSGKDYMNSWDALIPTLEKVLEETNKMDTGSKMAAELINKINNLEGLIDEAYEEFTCFDKKGLYTLLYDAAVIINKHKAEKDVTENKGV